MAVPWARGGTGRRRPPKTAGIGHGSSTLPGSTPLADATDAIETALEDEADRTRRSRVLRARLDEARRLIDQVEHLNLAEVTVVPGWIGQRLAQLDRAVRKNDDPAPETPAEALDRLCLVEDVLCRERQPVVVRLPAARRGGDMTPPCRSCGSRTLTCQGRLTSQNGAWSCHEMVEQGYLPRPRGPVTLRHADGTPRLLEQARSVAWR